MDTQTPQPGETGSESSRMMAVSPDTVHNGTQQELRHRLVHHHAVNAATKHKTQDADLKMVHRMGSSKNKN